MIPTIQIILSLLATGFSMYLLQDVLPAEKGNSSKLKYYLTRASLSMIAAFFLLNAFSGELKMNLAPYVSYVNSVMILVLFYELILSKNIMTGPKITG